MVAAGPDHAAARGLRSATPAPSVIASASGGSHGDPAEVVLAASSRFLSVIGAPQRLLRLLLRWTPFSCQRSAFREPRLQRDVARSARRYNSLHIRRPRRRGCAVNLRHGHHATAPPKILVVDDDVRLRDLLSRYLTEQGFQVADAARRARSRQEAAARSAAPDRARPHAAGRGRPRRSAGGCAARARASRSSC